MKKTNKFSRKLETLVAGVVLGGLSLGFVYGAIKGGEYLVNEVMTTYHNYCIEVSSDNGYKIGR